MREFKGHGHDVRLIAPQFVKPFVKSDKNDRNDAEAICEAVQRPNMRFVAEKSRRQQAIQTVHRVRSNRVARRTELCNEIRGLLSDAGITAPMGLSRLLETVNKTLAGELLEGWEQQTLENLRQEWTQLEGFISESDRMIKDIFESHPLCQRLTTIPGVGPITATALLGAVGDVHNFRTGRHLSAWLGLVPRQHSSGGKHRLGGITKRGDTYIRTLLIHGGRAVVSHCAKKTDRRSRWVAEKMKTRGKNKAAVAVANKNARVIWKIMSTEEVYKEFA